MSRRNNKSRTNTPAAFVPEVPTPRGAQFDFASPTEFVALPSGGRLYPPDHPFHLKSEVELKFMTARHEDILSSKMLLSRGMALERLLQELMVDEVNVKSLLVGDRNALFVAARVTAYGHEYGVKLKCPSCGAEATHEFDLSELGMNTIPTDVETTAQGTFMVNLPKSGVEVELKFLNVREQEYLVKNSESKVKNNLNESANTDFLKMAIVSVNSETDKSKISSFIMNMPAMDSLAIRRQYNNVSPDIDLKQDYHCSSCGSTTALEVPLDNNFFWPR